MRYSTSENAILLKKYISASVYNGNMFALVRNESFHIRVVWSSDIQSEGRGPLGACQTVCFPTVSYKENDLLCIISKYFTKFVYPL